MLRLGRVLGCAVEPPERRVERVAEQGEGGQVVLSACLCARSDPNGHSEGEKGEMRLVWRAWRSVRPCRECGPVFDS